MRLKLQRLGQQVFKRGHIHNPGQAGYLQLGCLESHFAPFIAFDVHAVHLGGVLRLGPAAQGFQQSLGRSVQGVGPHIGLGRAVDRACGRRRNQADAKPLPREQEGQRAAHNAVTANANI